MKQRYTLRCAVFLLLTKIEDNQEYVLLQRRTHTGILDGYYDLACSGHLEESETIKQAMIREAKEEIGITLTEKDLIFSSTMHARFHDADYILITFTCSHYEGIPYINEPEKCDQLKWFTIENLPDTLADTRKIMIENYRNNNLYTEYCEQK